MYNLEYISQKILWYGLSESIEVSAKIYLLGLGYNDVFICSEKDIEYKILSKYKSDKFKRLIQIIKGYSENNIGIPDLIAIKDENIIFIEIKRITKNTQDSLSQNQLKWIENHPEYKVIVFGLELDEIQSLEFSQIERLKEELKELRDELNKRKEKEFFNVEKKEILRNEILDKYDNLNEQIRRRKLDCDKKDMNDLNKNDTKTNN